MKTLNLFSIWTVEQHSCALLCLCAFVRHVPDGVSESAELFERFFVEALQLYFFIFFLLSTNKSKSIDAVLVGWEYTTVVEGDSETCNKVSFVVNEARW